MVYTSIVLAALLGLASAAPSNVLAAPPQFGFAEVAKFDDLTALPAAALPLGNYKHLYYQGFNVVSQGIIDTQLVGVKPQSPSNVAAADFLSTTTQGKPTLMASYSGSNTVTFDFRSFYFGCVLAEANSLTSTPASCTVTITGFSGNNRAVATQKVKFAANGQLQNMKKVTLKPAFRGLTSVTFDTTSANGDATVALLTDTFQYGYYTVDGKRH